MNIIIFVAATAIAGADSSGCSFDWLPTEGLPGLNGSTSATVVWDPDGPGPEPELLVVGGGFEIAGDKTANGIAAWDGTNWQAFATETYASALTVYKGELIAAGAAAYVDDTYTTFVMRWDGSVWERLGIGFSGGVAGYASIRALTTYGGALIAAGSFIHADGSGANNIARWDGSQWRPLGSGLTRLNSTYVHVDSLVEYKGDLIAGGNFDTAGGNPARGIARWDGSDWWEMGAGTDVEALIVADGDLIRGGSGIARWDGTQWHSLGGVTGSVKALAVFQGDIIAAGGFDSAGDIPASQIARWDGVAWHPLGDGISRKWDPGGGCDFPIVIDPYVRTLAVYRGELIAGGGFKFAGGKAARHIARWNGDEWNVLGPAGMSIEPGALTVHEGRLIAGGGFRALTVEGNARSLITAWSGHSWETLGDGVAGLVRALASYQGDIFVGGQFGVSETGARLIARWDGAQWQPLGTGIGRVRGCETVTALAVYGNDLIVGGDFQGEEDTNPRSIARWDGDTWHALGRGIVGSVWAMTIYRDKLIVGGSFDSSGGNVGRHIAAWDGSDWAPLGAGLDGAVDALTVWEGDLIAFYLSSGEQVARWDGASWTAMGRGTDNQVSALAVYNGELFATGDFYSVGGTPASSIARFDGTTWHALPGGMILWAWALTVYQGELIVGGSASLSDGTASANWSRWGPTNIRGDFDADADIDLFDFSELQECLTGPAEPTKANASNECLCSFNREGDGDIDLADAALFQNAFTASSK